jgi:hypothetical protein
MHLSRIIVALSLISILLISLSGCTSSLSDTPVSDSSHLAVAINLKSQETNDGYSSGNIEVILTDNKGRAVNNSSIKVKVNGIEIPLWIKQDLYYGKHPTYTLTDDGEEGALVAENTLYTFTLVLSNSTEHLIGSIKTPGKLSSQQFSFPDTLSGNEDFTLHWEPLPASVEMTVYRLTEAPDSTGSMVLSGGQYDTEALQKKAEGGTVSEKKRKWRIPAAYMHIPNGQVTDLGFIVTSTKEGEIKGDFLPGSYIRFTASLERYISVAD